MARFSDSLAFVSVAVLCVSATTFSCSDSGGDGSGGGAGVSGSPAAGTGTAGAPSSGSGGTGVSGSPAGGAPPATAGASGAPAGGSMAGSLGGSPTAGTNATAGSAGAAIAGMSGSPASAGTGPTAGAGGTPSTGGASGGPATAGTGTGGTTGPGFFSEGFETGTTGKQPAGWDNFVSWVKNGTNPSGDIGALVSETRAHSGTRSVHFHGAGNPAMITRALPPGTNKLYVRAWVYMSRQLGMNPGANHETLIGIRKTSGMASDEVRFGEIKGVIGTNEVPTDNITPKQDKWGMGPVVPKDKWVCFEVAFLGDKPQHELRAWADGTLVHEVTMPDQWNNGAMPATWLNGKFNEVILGWHSFSSQTVDVWMDDIVLSTAPVGCN